MNYNRKFEMQDDDKLGIGKLLFSSWVFTEEGRRNYDRGANASSKNFAISFLCTDCLRES
jgi:hypothetical protein